MYRLSATAASCPPHTVQKFYTFDDIYSEHDVATVCVQPAAMNFTALWTFIEQRKRSTAKRERERATYRRRRGQRCGAGKIIGRIRASRLGRAVRGDFSSNGISRSSHIRATRRRVQPVLAAAALFRWACHGGRKKRRREPFIYDAGCRATGLYAGMLYGGRG